MTSCLAVFSNDHENFPSFSLTVLNITKMWKGPFLIGLYLFDDKFQLQLSWIGGGSFLSELASIDTF
jgi:hypothetical protein